jgi:short-subunit dehydrogenase
MSKKLIVIVGTGPGVGVGVAKKFGAHEFRVVLVSRNSNNLQQYVKELTYEGIEAYGLTADAGNSESLEAVFAHIQQNYGTTDVLVYNAAVLTAGAPSSLTAKTLINDLQVDVAGALTSHFFSKC